MGNPRNWFRKARRKLISRTTQGDIVFLHSNATPTHDHEEQTTTLTADDDEYEHETAYDDSTTLFSLEEAAAIKIQACFRGHLARRAFRALRSLVKLQALARGVCVRRQARIALHFMHALVRLQVRVRARQLLNQYTEESDA